MVEPAESVNFEHERGSPYTDIVIQSTAVPNSKDNELFFRCQRFKAVKLEYLKKIHFLHPRTTHLIVGNARCLNEETWLPEVSFDFGCRSGRLMEDVYIPPIMKRGGKTRFDSWSVIVLLDDKEEKDKILRILQSGKANIHAFTVNHVATFSKEEFKQLGVTHIFGDPRLALNSDQFLDIIKRNVEDEIPVKIFATSYITQFLVSKEKVDWKNYVMTQIRVVELHLRHFHLSANLPITDYQRLGSPAFGISTQLVRKVMKKAPPIDRRKSQDVQPVSHDAEILHPSRGEKNKPKTGLNQVKDQTVMPTQIPMEIIIDDDDDSGEFDPPRSLLEQLRSMSGIILAAACAYQPNQRNTALKSLASTCTFQRSPTVPASPASQIAFAPSAQNCWNNPKPSATITSPNSESTQIRKNQNRNDTVAQQLQARLVKEEFNLLLVPASTLEEHPSLAALCKENHIVKLIPGSSTSKGPWKGHKS